MFFLRRNRLQGVRVTWPDTTLVDTEAASKLPSGARETSADPDSRSPTNNFEVPKPSHHEDAFLSMKTVYALFRLPRRGGSELVGIYSTRLMAESLVEPLGEKRRRGFRIEAFALDGLPGEDLWFDRTPNRELPSTVMDPLALLLDQMYLVVDRWIRDFDRERLRRRAAKRRRLKSKRTGT